MGVLRRGKEGDVKNEKIAEALLAARHRSGHTQASLSEESGIVSSKISDYERGVYLPSVPTLIALADAMGASIDVILGRESFALKGHRQ
jgi:transcriptional regulator with XRE-family HTH domain